MERTAVAKKGLARDDDRVTSPYRLPPYHYLHVLNLNTNVTRLETGPQNFVPQDNERVVVSSTRMITVSTRHACIIENPALRSDTGEVLIDDFGQVRLQHGDAEVRLAQEPFPLYPGEVLRQEPTLMKIVATNEALRLKALRDFVDEKNVKRMAGDEWHFEGPGTYIPRKEASVVDTVKAWTMQPSTALTLRAARDTVDRNGKSRVTGETWLWRGQGAYLPGPNEEVVSVDHAYVITEKKSLHLRAKRTFTDVYKKERKHGEEWLVTLADSDTHIPDVFEEVVRVVNITTLTNREYCVIVNPVDEDGRPQLGKLKLVKGEKSFFLMPGEELMQGIQKIHILGENQGLVLKANEKFNDNGVERQPGERWLIRGPLEYVPPVEVEVVQKREVRPMDENEGIYVRNMKTGQVRAVIGQTYMLTEDEELWEKELPELVEQKVAFSHHPVADRGDYAKGNAPAPTTRVKWEVISFRVPHNTAVQVYDFKAKTSRVVYGPELVMLGPDEQFTQLSLSAGRPKKANVIKTLCLLLGPDFCTDLITVETSDHARLSLDIAYSWHFGIEDRTNQEEAAKLFVVPDFVGDCCKAMASRIRGAVAGTKFDDFHKNSSKIIRASVFGFDANGKVRSRFIFKQNNLIITSVDIRCIEPVDTKTLDSLMKSVQMAIEITTNSQEATARHEAERLEQEAKGRLERQRISDEAEAERSRRVLLELQANSAAVESTGQAKAEAQSRAEASKIEGEAAVEQAKLSTAAATIEAGCDLLILTKKREAELLYQKQQDDLEIKKRREMKLIETQKFQAVVASLGAATIGDIASAGPTMKVKMLEGLGLKSTLITDGSSPINLFNTAHGLIGGLDTYHTRPSRTFSDDESFIST